MTCERFGRNTIVCFSPIYEHTFNGRHFRFEVTGFGGPWPVRRDGEPFKIVPTTFWPVFEDWESKQASVTKKPHPVT